MARPRTKTHTNASPRARRFPHHDELNRYASITRVQGAGVPFDAPSPIHRHLIKSHADR
jgi:hypothetical protein